MLNTKLWLVVALVAPMLLASGALAAFEVNNDACAQYRPDVVPPGGAKAYPPVPDGHMENINQLCAPSPTGVVSVFATDVIPREGKFHTSSIDYFDADGDTNFVKVEWCVKQVSTSECSFVSAWPCNGEGTLGNGFQYRFCAAPIPDWLCDVNTLVRCIDNDIVQMCATLPAVPGDDACDVVHTTAPYTVTFISRTSPIPTSGYIIDPGNDNRLVEASLTYWKIRDYDADGSLVIDFPVEGLAVSYQDGHWIVESLTGDPIMVDHETGLQRWAIRHT